MKVGDLVRYANWEEFGIDEVALVLSNPYHTKPRVRGRKVRTIVTILWAKSTTPCVEDTCELKVITCAKRG